MGDEDANFHGVVVALAIVIVVAGLIEIVRFFISLFMTLIRWQRWRDNTKQEASLAVSSRRGSTRRPKARLPPAHTALVGPVHSQNGGGDHFVRSWVVLTRQISSCAIKLRPYRFFSNAGRDDMRF
jgi:hypothetical protein